MPADLGGRIAHVWAGGRSTLDLLAPGLTLFAAHGEPAWEAAAQDAPLPITVRRLEKLTARALGLPDGGALPARSDGVPAGLLPAGAEPLRALPLIGC